MSNYYISAVCAFRKNPEDETKLQMTLRAMVFLPGEGVDPEEFALNAARGGVMPETEGWENHHLVVEPLDPVIASIIEAEKHAAPDEMRVVRFPVTKVNNE